MTIAGRQLAQVQREIDNLMRFVREGSWLESTGEELQRLEAIRMGVRPRSRRRILVVATVMVWILLPGRPVARNSAVDSSKPQPQP